jgi:hypothetical protein
MFRRLRFRAHFNFQRADGVLFLVNGFKFNDQLRASEASNVFKGHNVNTEPACTGTSSRRSGQSCSGQAREST